MSLLKARAGKPVPELASWLEPTALWQSLFWPLLRLLLGLALGLLAANALEALHWTRRLASLALPLARLAHMPPVAGAAFALAFVSPASANALLAGRRDANELSPGQLMLANLFNSLPAYLVHTPAIFLLAWPVLGLPAITYVGLTLAAAVARTAFTVLLGRLLLPAPQGSRQTDTTPLPATASASAALKKAWRRFCRRLPRLLGFTAPVYILMFALQRLGAFAALESWLSGQMDWLTFLKPQAVGIIVFHFAAELGAALGAAASLLETGGLDARDVVLALLVGNILSTPVRAVRHQFPAYAGFFRPAEALRLILANQGLRAASMALVTWLYYLWT